MPLITLFTGIIMVTIGTLCSTSPTLFGDVFPPKILQLGGTILTVMGVIFILSGVVKTAMALTTHSYSISLPDFSLPKRKTKSSSDLHNAKIEKDLQKAEDLAKEQAEKIGDKIAKQVEDAIRKEKEEYEKYKQNNPTDDTLNQTKEEYQNQLDKELAEVKDTYADDETEAILEQNKTTTDIPTENGVRIKRYYCQYCGREYCTTETIIGFLPQCPSCGGLIGQEAV